MSGPRTIFTLAGIGEVLRVEERDDHFVLMSYYPLREGRRTVQGSHGRASAATLPELHDEIELLPRYAEVAARLQPHLVAEARAKIEAGREAAAAAAAKAANCPKSVSAP